MLKWGIQGIEEPILATLATSAKLLGDQPPGYCVISFQVQYFYIKTISTVKDILCRLHYTAPATSTGF